MQKRKTWLWWSSGKDSAWALHRLMHDPNYSVEALVTTADLSENRSATHGVPIELVRAQAQALGLPLHIMQTPYPCSNQVYEAAVREIVKQAEAQGVTHMAFGDLFLSEIREYREGLFADSAIEVLFPLWQEDTTQLALEMIQAGLSTYLTAVNTRLIDADFAGRRFDNALLAALPASADPCGECGEFHTFVNDMPDFSAPIAINVGEVELRDGFAFAELQLPKIGV